MRTTVSATITARVGGGTKAHAFHVSIQWAETWKDRPAHVAVYTGQVYCGSQRAMSGSRPTGLNTAGVTCERCLAQGKPRDYESSYELPERGVIRQIMVADATRALAIDARGRLIPTQWAIDMVTPNLVNPTNVGTRPSTT